jgi:hypothetical protein
MAAFLVVGNRRIRLRFFIILALLLEGAFYLFFSNKPAVAYGTISFGKLDVAHKGLAVIIREEKVYTAPAYGEAVYLVADGSEVEAGEPIAVLYKEIYDEDIVKQLYDVQEKIIGYQQEQLMDQVISNDITKINADMDILVSEVQASVKDMEYNELANLESNLRKLLENKQKLLDYQTEPDSYLTELYNKEANLMAQIEEWTMQVESPEAGFISFSIDGFENILGVDSLDKLTADDIEYVLEHSVQEATAIETHDGAMEKQQSDVVKIEQPFYKIVDPALEWYAVLLYNSTDNNFKQGDTVKAVFEGHEEMSALVTHVHKEKDQTILIMQFSGIMDRMINKRVYPLEIRKTVEGMMVPTGALHKNKGVQGIYVKDRDGNIFIETSIQALYNGYAIVESLSDDQVLQLHDQVLTDKQ